MSCIVYQKNKANGTIYAYESESYRDPVTKKPRCKRTYLGRVDPVTKQIIPKSTEQGKRNRASSAGTSGMVPEAIRNELTSQRERIRQLQSQVDELSHRDKESTELISKMKRLLASYD